MICPFKECGRKFPSDTMLKSHMNRRHKAPEKNDEQLYESMTTSAATETPIPSKNKSTLPKASLMEEKKDEFFQAKPKIQRPQTASTKN